MNYVISYKDVDGNEKEVTVTEWAIWREGLEFNAESWDGPMKMTRCGPHLVNHDEDGILSIVTGNRAKKEKK